MKYLVIGLGKFGINLARNLAAQGNEVIGVDKDPGTVDRYKDDLATAYCVNTTDETALSVLPLKTVDLVIVAIGEDFGNSVKTVALLKKSGVRHIYARAIDELHYAILQCIDIDRILRPEQRAATDIAMEMMLGNDVTTMLLSESTLVVQMAVPQYFSGMNYADINSSDFGINIVAAARPSETRSLIGVAVTTRQTLDMKTDKVEQGDVIVCVTTRKTLRDMFRHIASSNSNL